MKNIGFVLYEKGEKPGTLTAKWCHSEDGSGTGIATGGPATGFEGRYKIQYYDEKQNLQAQRDLDIQKMKGHYHISWINMGKITCNGIGMETAEGLAVGYRNITNP